MKKIILISFLCLCACQQGPKATSPELEAKKIELKAIADAAKKKGDYSAASKLESEIISLDVNDPKSFAALAKSLRKQGKKQDALEILQTGEKLNPQNEELQLEVAKGFVETDRPDDAIAKLKSIKTLRNKDYYNALGISYDVKGQHKLAQEAFLEGLKIEKNDGLLLNNLALSYLLERNYAKGIEILEGLVKRPDALPKYRQNLALAYGISARPQEAYKLLVKDMSEKEAKENLKTYYEMRAKQ